jgi:hypothetical protein
VAVAGNYAYVADGGFGLLQVIDVSDPASPTIVGSVGTPGLASSGVAVAGEYAYVAGGYPGFQEVIDVSDPASPTIVGGVNTPHFACGVAVAGEYAYVADGESGLQVLPAQCQEPVPVELAWFEIVAIDAGVKVTWETSFEANHLGFYIYRAEAGSGRFDRVNDELVEGAGRAGRHYEFVDLTTITGETYLYRLEAVGTQGGRQTFALGSVTVGLALPAAMVLHQNSPNPFNPVTSIGFELPEASHVILRVYDVRGSIVRTLVDDRLAPSFHSIDWDGHDDLGHRVASGVYYCRLESGSRSMSRKMVLVQ